MPMLDFADQVLSSYAPTSTGTTLQSYIDRLALMEDAAGASVDVIIQIAATATSGGSATVQFQAVGNATDPTFASGNKVLFDSGVIAVASLAAGYQISGTFKRQPHGSLEAKTNFYRYETIIVIIGTAALTAGTFNGWLTNHENIQDNLSYPAGYSVR